MIRLASVALAARLLATSLLATMALDGAAAAMTPLHPVKTVVAGRLALPNGAGQIPVAISQDWSQPDPAVTSAVIIVHGRLRNADTYFRSLVEAAQAAGKDDARTLLIAPQFLADIDGERLTPEILRWHGDDWMGGLPALAPSRASAFDGLDAILLKLADRRLFPNLKHVTVAGHSGGGQVVQRYAILGKAGDPLVRAGIAVRYLVANPSSYAYFGSERPRVEGNGFVRFDAATCPDYDDWKYGMRHLPPYADRSPEALEQRYITRDVTYLLGGADTDPEQAVLDRSCAAEAQGPYRLARGRAYIADLRLRHPLLANGGPQRLVEVPGVGHNGRGMLTSVQGEAALFGP